MLGGGGGVNLGSAYGQVIIDTSGANAGIGSVQKSLGGLQKGLLGLNPVTLAAGAAIGGVGVAVGGLGGIIASSTKKAASLEAQLSAIQAVSGSTADEMLNLKALIQDLAIDPNLKVSATEAADAVEMLARNGLSATQILDGAAKSTVLLANATGADFGLAADIATDSMAIFNIEAKDMEKAVDGITSVVNNSKFSIDDYRLALAQGGGVAGAVGVEFNDFNTAIAGMAPLFGSGSDAGTSFKTMLQRLIPQSEKAAGYMEKLGLFTGLTSDQYDKTVDKIAKVEQKMADLDPESKNYEKNLAKLQQQHEALSASLETGQSAFFDAEGNMKSMTEISGALQNALGGLSEAQRTEALSVIFGTDAMRAAVGLAELGAEGFANLQAAMGETSAAENAATRIDNLSGDLEILQSVIEGLQVRIGDKFIPALRDGVKKATAFLSDNADSIVDFFGKIADVINAFTSGSPGDFPWEDIFPPWLSDLMYQVSAGFETARDSAAALFDYISFVLEYGDTLNDSLLDLPEAARPFAKLLGDMILWTRDDLPGIISNVVGSISELVAAFNEGGFEGLANKFWEWVTGSDGVEAQSGPMVDRILDAIIGFLSGQWPKINSTLTEWSDNFWDWVLGPGGAIERSGEALTSLTAKINTWAQSEETQGKLRELGRLLGLAMVDGLILIFNNNEKAVEMAIALQGMLGVVFVSMLPSLSEIGSSIGGGVLAGIYEKITGGEASSELTTFFGEMWKSVMKAVISTIVPGTGPLFAGAQFESMKTGFDEIDFGELGRNIVEGIKAGLAQAAQGLVDEAVQVAKDAYEGMKDYLGINSPSTLFAGIGQNMSLGLATGIGGSASVPMTEMASLAKGVANQAVATTATTGSSSTDNSMVIEGDVNYYIDGAQDPKDIVDTIDAYMQRKFRSARPRR